MDADDEAELSEITILPDGRVYVFGTSRPIMEVLSGLNPGDPALASRLIHIRQFEAGLPLETSQWGTDANPVRYLPQVKAQP